MEEILDGIDSPVELRNLNIRQKEKLASELRSKIIDAVAKNGGHLASNLGVVELTIALHSVFNTPTDKIIWDVGHQTYSHKIITGRKGEFDSLRQQGGISGFPKKNESEYDAFNTGHSSTSISVALGMARARDIKKENHKVIAVIGDGALTGGMALEALNDAGSSQTNLIVILNDNEMSIAKNVGGISMSLSRVRTKRLYTHSNNYIKKMVKKIPYIGEKIVHFTRKIKYSIKQLFIQNMLFEDMGFTYFGPINGHDIDKLEGLLRIVKNLEGPILIHLNTKKGKGYEPAEKEPDRFHSSSSFDIETGKPLKAKSTDYSKVFGDKLVELAKNDERIVAITASMRDGTGLKRFSQEFPDRFFDVAIAEQHALGMAAGLANAGMIPVVPIYSSFYQRCYDQVIHDIALQKLPVVMCVDRAGIVGNDGETHQGIFDLSFFSIVPNLTVMAPKDFEELEQMLEFAVKLKSPVVIRYPRGDEGKTKFVKHDDIELGKCEILNDGNDITIVAIGKMVDRAMCVAERLKEEGKSVEVINVRFLKPLDEGAIVDSIKKTKNVITIEDNVMKGGLATAIKELIVDKGLGDIKVDSFAYPDEFIAQGTVQQIEGKYGLNEENICTRREICSI